MLGTAAAVAGIGGRVDCWCWKDSRAGVVSVEGGRFQQAGQQLQVRPERVPVGMAGFGSGFRMKSDCLCQLTCRCKCCRKSDKSIRYPVA